MDFEQLEVRMGEKKMPLTLMEASLLRYLVEHEGKPVSRKNILEKTFTKVAIGAATNAQGQITFAEVYRN